MFPELHKIDEFAPLAAEVLADAGASVSPDLRRTILFRAARSAAIHGSVDEATRLLAAGQAAPGSVPDGPARARIAVASGHVDEAIQILRDATDGDSWSVLLSVLAEQRGDEAALCWFTEKGLSVDQLTSLGILSLCQSHLRRNDFEAVSCVLSQTTREQFAHGCYLYFFRGVIRFARLLPVPERPKVLSGMPLDVRHATPIVIDPTLSAELDAATNDFRQALPLSTALGLRHVPRIIECYIVWCELLHPARKEAALTQLRRDMQDCRRALSLVHTPWLTTRHLTPRNSKLICSGVTLSAAFRTTSWSLLFPSVCTKATRRPWHRSSLPNGSKPKPVLGRIVFYRLKFRLSP